MSTNAENFLNLFGVHYLVVSARLNVVSENHLRLVCYSVFVACKSLKR